MTDRPIAYTIASPECRTIPELAYQAELSAALDALAELGYDGVEIQVRDADAASSSGLLDEVTGRGLRIAALATGPVATDDGLTLTSPDPTVRAEARHRVRAIVELAIDYAVPVTLGRTRGDLQPGAEDLQRRWASEAIRELADHAAAGGQQLLVEPQSVGNFLLTVDETLRFLDAGETHRSNGIALVFDVWHAARCERSVEAAAAAAGTLLQHVQLADSDRGPLGRGEFDVASFLGFLDGLGYDGWLTLEHRQDPGSRDAAAASLSVLRALRRTT